MNKATVRELCSDMHSGGTPSTKHTEYWNGDIPWLSSAESSNEYIDHANQFITHAGIINSSTKRAEKGSVLIATAGEGKTRGQVSFLEIDAYINQSLIAMKANEDKILTKYLYYYLKNSYYRLRSLSDITGIRGSLSGALLGDYEVSYPDLTTQKNSISLLSAIDLKIRNNTAICSDLEDISKLLYEYWFVQFDFPDENGKPYKSSGGKMVWNDDLKREIPEGWEIKPLGQLISVIRGISYEPTDELKTVADNTVSLLKSNNIQNGSVNFDQPVYLPKSLAGNDQWLTKGSVFITMSSGSKAHMGKTAIIYKDMPYVFGSFCAKIDINKKARCFVSTYFRSVWFRAYIENVTAGTSINNIGNEQITGILIPMPEDDILRKFENHLQASFDKQGELIEENQQLASLRDFLLPRYCKKICVNP